MNNPVIRAINLSKTYVNNRQNYHALTDINFSLDAGKTLALLGHNGAGKSTLIKLILGLIQPSQGEILLMGNHPSTLRCNNHLSVGYLPENVSFYENMTGKEMLEYFASLKKVSKAEAKRILAEFGLEYAQHQQVRTYSKGMRQKLGLAQATLANPQILLLDEPTVGLDPLASAFLYQKMRELKQQGCTVIVCTHELGLVENEMDVALILGQGQLLAKGTLTDLRVSSELKIKIRFNDCWDRIEKDPYLSQFLSGDQTPFLACDLLTKQQIIQYLVQQKSIFDFSIKEPDLVDIFHFYMDNLFKDNNFNDKHLIDRYLADKHLTDNVANPLMDKNALLLNNQMVTPSQAASGLQG